MNLYLLNVRPFRTIKSGEVLSDSFLLDKACGRCGTNFTFNELPIKIRIQFKEEIFETAQQDIVISESLYKTCIDNKMLLGTLKLATNRNGNSQAGYRWFVSDVTLPRMSPSSTGIIYRQCCDLCNQCGFFDDVAISNDINKKSVLLQRQYVYDRMEELLLQERDIFNTWERFGISRLKEQGTAVVNKFARPRIIVTKKLANFLTKLNLATISFEEVRVGEIVSPPPQSPR